MRLPDRARWLSALRPVALAAGWIAVWQLVTTAAGHPYFPGPVRIAEAAGQLWLSGPPSRLWLGDTVTADIVPSLARMLGGWAGAGLLGVALGLWLGRCPRAFAYARVPIALARAVPQPLLVPVFLVILGLTTTMEVVTIITGVIWPVLLNTLDGARAITPELTDTMRAFRLSRARWVLWIVIPAAAPRIFAGLRISLAIALILMVISELVGSTSGIGYQLNLSRSTFALPQMWAWICLIGALGYTLHLLLQRTQRHLLAWQHHDTERRGPAR
ncbi:ABC-type nitrate/sulfonate/bicarbonate transport system, permease component [Lentzea xinjiangensis]|uniref:ABC-type nitrate/sulfonate/bicarbonate transport system, permease component n=1 Tax=Lentzea xinjiangensis TaxID=402600 RepID=A0A1H9W6L3_9PSEU|nr:ABC transporter permease subunit [Lentzea xinjiangensis]SES29113.1 ABC-type nitrate/sulfonate/bicarbonate transport system, permease component [Lentzea xinjiangensis]